MQPFAKDAVRVRLWDDLAKVEGAVTPPLAHFVAVLEAAQRRAPALP
jgi:predicted HD phosphohydrolase